MRGLSKPISSISLIFASSSGPCKRSLPVAEEEEAVDAVVAVVAAGFSAAEVLADVVAVTAGYVEAAGSSAFSTF